MSERPYLWIPPGPRRTRALVLAFVALCALGLGTLIGVGCAIGANECPFGSRTRLTTLDPAVLYAADCAACHGRLGEGTRAGKPLASGDALKLSIEQMRKLIADGKPLSNMPSFKRLLSREQVEVLADYVMVLQGRASPSPSPGTSPGASASAGAGASEGAGASPGSSGGNP